MRKQVPYHARDTSLTCADFFLNLQKQVPYIARIFVWTYQEVCPKEMKSLYGQTEILTHTNFYFLVGQQF
jgi:hypothetical protein